MMAGVRNWIGRFIRRQPAPAPALRGAPESPRIKRYTAMSGYVYEYVYRGFREDGAGRRHSFTVSSDRKTWFDLEVAVDAEGLAGWEKTNGRELNSAERYAVAKLALFEAFDERENPAAMRLPVDVPGERIAALLEKIEL
jgi:hypothetical protein